MESTAASAVLIDRLQLAVKAPVLWVAVEQIGDAFSLKIPGFCDVKMSVEGLSLFRSQETDDFLVSLPPLTLPTILRCVMLVLARGVRGVDLV